MFDDRSRSGCGTLVSRMSGRWLVAALLLVSLATVVFWIDCAATRSERAARSLTEPLEPAGVEPPVTAATRDRSSDLSEREWRLEVEIRDEDNRPVSGRVYLTDSSGDLLSALDTAPPAPLVQRVRGTVSIIAYVWSYIPQFHEKLTPPSSGVRSLVARLERGPGISGMVVDDTGAPVTTWGGSRVAVRPLDPPRWLWRKSESWRSQTDETGRWFVFDWFVDGDGGFRLQGLPPGRYEIRCELRRTPRSRPNALLAPEPVIAFVGDADVRIVCPRAVEVRVRFVEASTGELLPPDALATWTAEHEDWRKGGSGSWVPGPTLEVAPGVSFAFSAEVEGYVSPERTTITARNEPGVQEVPVRFRRDPDGLAELELVVKDDAGAPASPLWVGHGPHWQRLSVASGHYVLRIPAGVQRIGLGSPQDEVLRFMREWVRSVDDDPQGFEFRHPYLSQEFDVDLPRGGHASREVTMQRAALIWVRHDPEAYVHVRLWRGDVQVKDAFTVLPQSMGLVGAVEPATYVVEGQIGKVKQDSPDVTRIRYGAGPVRIDVEAKPGEVAEVWLRTEKR